jgi:RNA polymerase sigma factor for flagellar operon FliA
MRLNQGIEKYRSAAKTERSKAPEAKSAAPRGASSTSKPSSGNSGRDSDSKSGPKSGKSVAKKEDVEKLKTAVEETAEAEALAAEEAALQKEIAEELEKESAQTNQLVKEDFSPVNSTRERLVKEYAPLIKYIAQKIAARLPANIELDDLISSGVIGLMDAIEKYDSRRDNKFKTYAEFRIRGAILDELRAQDWVPRSVREKAKVLERCYAKIEQASGRQATDEEVCAELNISQEEYHDLLNQVRSVSLLSYDDISNFSKADKRSLHGVGDAGAKAPTPFNEVNVAYIKKMIAEAIQDLPEKQRLVLSLYYYEDLNLKEIGRVLDVTESRVSQLHTQAILRLKGKLRNHWDEFVTLFG